MVYAEVASQLHKIYSMFRVQDELMLLSVTTIPCIVMSDPNINFEMFPL